MPGRRQPPWHGAATPETRPAQPFTPGRGRSQRVPWADLLQKVFAVDVLACQECGGRLEVLAFITAPAVAKQILDHLGLSAQAPPVARPSSGDEPAETLPEYDCVDPVYEA